MPILRVKATAAGRRVWWSDFKQSRLVDAPFSLSPAPRTILTNVVTDLCAECESLDRNCHLVTVIPNGFRSFTFNLAITGNGFEVTCTRRMVRGWFPLNPFAAESAANFDIIVTINGEDEVVNKLTAMIKSKYECSDVS